MDRKLVDLAEQALWRFRLYRPAVVRRLLAVAAAPALLGLAARFLLHEPRPLLDAAAVLGVVATLALLSAVLAPSLIVRLQNRKAAAWRRTQYRRPRTVRGVVDWSSIASYVDLRDAAFYEDPRTLGAFMEGPFRRYMELCSDETEHIRVRARIMEFARGSVDGFRERHARRPQAARELDAAVAAELERRFGADRRALIEVYQGLRGHH